EDIFGREDEKSEQKEDSGKRNTGGNMMQNIKIGLTGKMRSGKDTLADYLVENYGFTKFAFGDALKRYVHEIFDVNPNEKPRDIYQRFGQYCRSIDGGVWVRKCFQSIAENDRGNRVFRPIITDIRQPNEYARCRAEGLVISRVKADDRVRLERARAACARFDAESMHRET